ncbi:MAG: DNA repair protein RecO [Ruminococcus sp.]|nr:DNA repair protein RecO [Ruminococcus sp.]
MIRFDALIIKEKRLGDNKLIYVLTKEYGVITVYCHGGFAPKNKNTGATQLFSYSELCVDEKISPNGERRYFLNSSTSKTIFYNIRLDIVNSALAGYIAELLNYCGVADNDYGEVMRLTLNTYYSLNSNRQPPDLLKSIFEIRLLCEIGFRPNLIGCNKCYKYEDDDLMHFNIHTGKVLCSSCITQNELDNGFDFSFDKQLFYVFRYIALTDYNKLFSFKISDSLQDKLTVFSESFVNYHLKSKFVARDFYKMIKA